jgi:hypothetical protein
MGAGETKCQCVGDGAGVLDCSTGNNNLLCRPVNCAITVPSNNNSDPQTKIVQVSQAACQVMGGTIKK